MSVIFLALRPGAVPNEQMAQIREMAPDHQVIVSADRAKIEELLPDIEIAAGDFPRNLLPLATSLRWWQGWYGGVDWLLDQPNVAASNIILTNASGLHAVPITEHIFAMLLAFGRDLHNVIKAQSRKEWISHDREDVFELADKTMLLIGVGGIGSHTAKVARAFGMRVVAVRRHPERPLPGVDQIVGISQLLDVLPEADFVVNTLPLTLETKGLVGEAHFKAMAQTAYFVNIGRGRTVDESALIQAVQEGWIAGAGLDVFETEPLPPDSPLWEMDNVIVSPHYAGQTNRYDQRAMEIFLDNLARYLAGEPLRNEVDKKLGY